MLFRAVISSCLFFAILAADHHHAWDYKETGRDWPGLCQAGRHQSPIYLSSEDAVVDHTLGNLNFDYAANSVADYVNNGHSIAIRLTPDSPKSKLSGGGLPGDFIFHSLHFHWGGLSHCDGSEHIFDDKCTPFEMHMVHYNSKYDSLKEAAGKKDGLAVVGIMFKEARSKTSVKSKLGKFLSQDFNQVLDQIKTPKDTVTNRNVNMSKYIEDLSAWNKFFRYAGSLTTPTCDETVTWTVMTKIMDVDPALLAKFRDINLKNAHGENKPSPNYRGLQDLNDRTVYLNDYVATSGSIFTRFLLGALGTILV